MEKVVISLGGSIIVPDEVDYNYLKKFSKVIKRNSRKHKFVIVCGGGHTAREYISALEHTKADKKMLSLVGILSTKLNARLVNGVFGYKSKIPDSVKEVKSLLGKKNIVICGALGCKANRTTDSNAAELAKELKADYLINMTDVKGLYDKDPKRFKNAKFISSISFKDFHKIVNKIKFKAGQHFVLDQAASKIVMENDIKTVIISSDLKNLARFLKGKKSIGTIIQ